MMTLVTLNLSMKNIFLTAINLLFSILLILLFGKYILERWLNLIDLPMFFEELIPKIGIIWIMLKTYAKFKYKIPLFEPPPKDLKEDFRYLKNNNIIPKIPSQSLQQLQDLEELKYHQIRFFLH